MKLLDILFETVVDMDEEKGKKMTKDEFIQSAQSIHKNKDGTPKYTYGNVDYVNNKTDVMITCPIHGDFPQKPYNHLLGRGCKYCFRDSKKSNTQDFILKAQKKHFSYDEDGNKIPKYTYGNVDYVDASKDVMITCPIHGDFPQSPNTHLKGSGCGKCQNDNQRMTKDEFIQQSKEIHDNKYTYNNVNYVNNKTDVMITCPIHGDFPQSPANHLKGSGCDNCFRDSKKSNTQDFIKKAQLIHHKNNKNKTPKYTYDNVDYIDANTKVLITCPIHSPKQGDFPQTPHSHLQGSGCPWCSESKGEKLLEKILNEKNIKYVKFKEYNDCISIKSKTGLTKRCYKLKFDFYLPENNTLVEFDGTYHFNEKIHRKPQGYINQVLNDREKNGYTKLNGIKLIRIGYFDDKKVEEELMKGLDSNDQLYLSTKYPIDKGWRDTTIKV